MQSLSATLLGASEEPVVQTVRDKSGLPSANEEESYLIPPPAVIPISPHSNNSIAATGWRCPCCYSVFAPHIDFCPDCDNSKFTGVPSHVTDKLKEQLVAAEGAGLYSPINDALFNRHMVRRVVEALESISTRTRPSGRLEFVAVPILKTS
jgi:hypothetical protein